jgi:hypothetical protein
METRKVKRKGDEAMKKLVLALLVVGMALPLAAPAGAAGPEPIGDRINIYVGGSPQTFSAGAPFHIRHGWQPDPTAGLPIGLFSFELEMDGQAVDADFVLTYRDDEGRLVRQWVHNFPAGMTGVHTFTGHWFAPSCPWAVDEGPCRNPGEIVEAWTSEVVVTFQ